MPSFYQFLLIALAGLVALRLGMTSREREFARSLLADGAERTTLQGAHLLGIRQGALWKRYLWSLRWRRLSDSPFDVADASHLRARCARWLAFDVVTGIACVGLLLVLWKGGAIQ